MTRLTTLIWLSALTIAAATPMPVAAQTPNTPTPCQGDLYRAFDFWLGHWDVYDTQGKKLGENVITSQEGGCLILEQWTSASGGTGQSYNYVDVASGPDGEAQWRQIWVSQGFTIDYSGNLNDTGTLELIGTITYRNGTKAPFKGQWTPQDDGSVRQYFEQYDKAKEQWTPWFLGIYRKHQAAE